MRCFCGCGRRVPRDVRDVNRRGARIGGDVAGVRDLLDRGLRSPNAESFVRDGEVLCAALADDVHRGAQPEPQVDYESRGFMAFGHAKFSEEALAAALRRSPMPVSEAVGALARGEWDPYADVEMEY
jgi:hypothetical protein